VGERAAAHPDCRTPRSLCLIAHTEHCRAGRSALCTGVATVPSRIGHDPRSVTTGGDARCAAFLTSRSAAAKAGRRCRCWAPLRSRRHQRGVLGGRACSESAVPQNRGAVAIAHIQACVAWARHDCFCPRARPARAIATPRKELRARGSPARYLATTRSSGPGSLSPKPGPASRQTE
jgi:hypothetical protein